MSKHPRFTKDVANAVKNIKKYGEAWDEPPHGKYEKRVVRRATRKSANAPKHPHFRKDVNTAVKNIKKYGEAWDEPPQGKYEKNVVRRANRKVHNQKMRKNRAATPIKRDPIVSSKPRSRPAVPVKRKNAALNKIKKAATHNNKYVKAV